ncbi:hypothetical protein GTW43_26550, partial [Streptomyces sp. SID5785]|nr:hypothetical protein [Streptomyces sp. SID5785]
MPESKGRLRPRAPEPRSDHQPERRIAVDRAEAVLVEQYTRLVRLAYLVLPDDRGRHRRVLDAHRLVQRALPRVAQDLADGPDTDPYAWLRTRVVRAALGARRTRGLQPAVIGLRLFPRAG